MLHKLLFVVGLEMRGEGICQDGLHLRTAALRSLGDREWLIVLLSH